MKNLVKQEKYQKLLKYTYSGSWTIWNAQDVFDTSVLTEANIIKNMNCKYIFVGLNPSKDVSCEWGSFHHSHIGGKDRRLANIFLNDEIAKKYAGCYITDFYKTCVTPNIEDIDMDCACEINKAKATLENELKIIGKPIILAFGKKTYKMIVQNIDRHCYQDIKYIKHYSCRMKNEDYFNEVCSLLVNL